MAKPNRQKKKESIRDQLRSLSKAGTSCVSIFFCGYFAAPPLLIDNHHMVTNHHVALVVYERDDPPSDQDEENE